MCHLSFLPVFFCWQEYRRVLEHYNVKCRSLAKKIETSPKYYPAAFVTFRTITSAMLAAKTPQINTPDRVSSWVH